MGVRARSSCEPISAPDNATALSVATATSPSGGDEYSRFRAFRFFGSLDGLRAASIIGVVWFHTWFGTPQADRLANIPVLRMGWFGVEVFFTISGFLITTLLLREQDKLGRISLRDFYVRRALRIWPLYYAVLVLYVGLVLVLERGTDRGRVFFHYLPYYATYTYTWAVPVHREHAAIFNFAWTLATEEQFYLFWPFVIQFLRPAWCAGLLVALSALRLATGWGLMVYVLPPDSTVERMALSIAVPICLGALLAQVLQTPRGFRSLHILLGRRWSSPLAATLLLIALIPTQESWRPLAWLAVTALVGSSAHGLATLLRWRPLAYIGVLSYGMYLFNTLAIKFTRPAAGRLGIHHPLLVFPLSLGVTVLVSWLSFRYFESPFLKLKTRFARLTPAPAEAAPVGIKSPEVGARVHP